MEAERNKSYGEVKTEGEKEQTPDYWKTYLEEKFQESKNFRGKRVEKQWMINYAYYKGHQNLRYNKTTGTLDWESEDPLKFQVNQIYAIVRAIRGAVTKDVPIWEVDAKPYGSIEQDEERLLGQYLAAQYNNLNMKHKTKELVLYGLLYGLGIFQYGFDPDADNGEGDVWVETFDPFDVYIDPHATGIEDARYVIKVVKRPVEVLKNNPMYENADKIQPDNKHSESSYKELLENRDHDIESGKGTVLLYEGWCVTSEGVRVITVAGGQVLRNEISELERLPFIIYQPDINPNEIYGEGWVKNLVPLNRALNYLERNTLEFHVMFAKGKYRADDNVKVKTITNENGQIVRTSPGGKFEQMDMKPMTSSVFNQIESIGRYMEDIGAAHETFMGRAPTGVTAAVAIEQLVANNMANLVDLQDNLEICLGELGTEILGLGYQYYDVTKTFKAQGNAEKEIFKVVGGNSMVKDKNAVQLPKDPEVRVTLGSGIAHTKGARQELAMGLYNAGVIDRRTLLERYGEDADEIERRLAQQQTGMPVEEGGMTGEELMAMQQPQDVPQEAPMQEGMQEAPGGGGPEAAIQDFLAEAESQGLVLDPTLENPEALLQIVSGQLEVDVVDGVIVPV